MTVVEVTEVARKLCFTGPVGWIQFTGTPLRLWMLRGCPGWHSSAALVKFWVGLSGLADYSGGGGNFLKEKDLRLRSNSRKIILLILPVKVHSGRKWLEEGAMGFPSKMGILLDPDKWMDGWMDGTVVQKILLIIQSNTSITLYLP